MAVSGYRTPSPQLTTPVSQTMALINPTAALSRPSPVVLKFAILGKEAPKPKAEFIELEAVGSIIDGIDCLCNAK